MTILSLFSGIGCLDLAVETLLGAETTILCERDAFARSVLARHWPAAACYEDVHAIENVGANVVCGGPPCQAISVAGKQLGDADPRFLWPEAVRVTVANRPRLALWENPTALLSHNDGRTFRKHIAEAFDAIGYATRWDAAEASAAGAPHRRDRVWIVCVRRDLWTPPTSQAPRRQSLFGYEDVIEWPRAGWYSEGEYGIERARWPRGTWPTPIATDGEKDPTNSVARLVQTGNLRGLRDGSVRGGTWPTPIDPPEAKHWPTPDAMVANLDESSESWHSRAEMLKERHHNGNGAGTPLAVAVRDADAIGAAPGGDRASQRVWPITPRPSPPLDPSRTAVALRVFFSSPAAGVGQERTAMFSDVGVSLPPVVVRPPSESPTTPRCAPAISASSDRGVGQDFPRGSPVESQTAWSSFSEPGGLESPCEYACGVGHVAVAIGQTLCDAVEIEGGKWATPKSSDHRSGKASDDTLDANSRPLQEQAWEASAKPKATGALNPAFSEWLMNVPAGWTEPEGPPLPHAPTDWNDVPLVYYGGRPAPAGMALLTTEKLNRRPRLKCLGNAVVRKCALMAFRALVDPAWLDTAGPQTQDHT